MALAATAGGLAGASIASGALVLTDPDERRDQPGQVGGPLVDAQGRVIGINTAIANPSTAQNVGFVIPITQAKPVIDRLRGGG